MSATTAAIGFRVKSGWAAAVVLSGPVRTPEALGRRVVQLSEADAPESRQPYHADRGVLEEDDATIRRRTTIVERATARSLDEALSQFAASGHRVARAGLVVGSMIDPATISHPHIRAHALEGRLFRTVLEDALRARGVPSTAVVERSAFTTAAKILDRAEEDVKRIVTDLGRTLGRPWRADEKLAALAAWMALAGR